ncbi:FliG C-terminal domain-containing protein [Pontibacterium sp.]|uniref:FliG C-terminal domain-containing protein n=1 Tax=Pontibacterium sp. TaxID=2036026 RepID=UPI003561545B
MTLSIKPGWQRLASMLAGMSPADSDAMIVQIRHDDPALADWLIEQRFSFTDLIVLAPVQLARLLAEVSDSDLILALRGLDTQQQQALLIGISKGRAANIQAELSVMAPVPRRNVEAAQQRIVDRSKRLEVEGRLTLTDEPMLG